MTRIVPLALILTPLLTGGLALSACDGGPASQPAREQAAPESGKTGSSAGDTGVRAAAGAADTARGPLPEVDPRTLPAPQVNGRPMWAANRRLTAAEAAQRQFARNGKDLGARTLDDFVRKAQDFTANPPAGAKSYTRRNGDRAIYDPKSNIFAVVSKDGAPRLIMKPQEGLAYWQKDKARDEAREEQRRERRQTGRQDEDRG
jgi:pyocin large subunit-like protein